MDWRFLVVLIIPFGIDVFFCVLSARRALRKNGASGVPIVTLFLYGYLIFTSSSLSYSVMAALFIIAVCVHLILLFVIPRIFERRADE